MNHKLIDTHAHLTYQPLASDIDGVIKRSIEAGTTAWITVGTGADENCRVAETIQQYDNLYGAVGIHPHHAKDSTNDDIDRIKGFAENKKIVALGEIGLDFYYDLSARDIQRDIFQKQLALAAELHLPAIIHSRDAFDDTIAILDNFGGKLKNIVFHCYSGSIEQTRLLMDRGWFVSFTGIITFKNAGNARETAAFAPLERIMLETDCPYICPEPMRKQKTNEPALLIYTARKLAEIKNLPVETVIEATTKNAQSFFGLNIRGGNDT